MSTQWVITTASDRVTLDSAMHGETTFTVTNPSERTDRAVFEVVPGTGADRSWFTVEEPQRRVPSSGSVSYVVKVALPPGTPAGSYTIQGLVYSADAAPEESSVLSGRLAVEAKGPAAQAVAAKRRPWWVWAAVAGLVVVVLAVVLGVVFGTRRSSTTGGAPAAAGDQVAVPDVSRQSLAQATTNLGIAGVKVGNVLHKHDPAVADAVLYQSVAGGSKVAKNSTVDLVVTVNLSAPAVVSPKGGNVAPSAFALTATPIPTRGPSPTPAATASPAPVRGVLQWTQTETWPTRWLVTVQQQVCATQLIALGPATTNVCGFLNPVRTVVSTNSFTPPLAFTGQRSGIGMYNTGSVQWQVTALDDFGNPGSASPLSGFTVG
jgi:hypothetical protein